MAGGIIRETSQIRLSVVDAHYRIGDRARSDGHAAEKVAAIQEATHAGEVLRMAGSGTVASLTGRSARTVRRWSHRDRIPLSCAPALVDYFGTLRASVFVGEAWPE